MTYQDDTLGTRRGARRTVSAFFDDRSDAEAAVESLRELGIADADIRLTRGQEPSVVGDGSTPSSRDEPAGFFEMLGEMFFPSEDRSAYAEGLSRGGHLVTVTGLSEDDFDDVVDILDDDGAVDMDERTATWRAEGWSETRYMEGRAGTVGTLDETRGITGFDEEDEGYPDPAGTGSTGMGSSFPSAAAGAGGMASAGETPLRSGTPGAGGGSERDTSDLGMADGGGSAGMGAPSDPGGSMRSGLNDESGIGGSGTGGSGIDKSGIGGSAGAELDAAERRRAARRDDTHGIARVRSYLLDDEDNQKTGLTDDDDLPGTPGIAGVTPTR